MVNSSPSRLPVSRPTSRPIVRALVENHFAHLGWPADGEPAPTFVRRLARRLVPATIEQLLLVLRADHLGRPPRVCPVTDRRIAQLATAARALAIANSAPAPLLLGRHLIAAGCAPGPQFKAVLAAAYEAQLDGVFTDNAGATTWLAQHLSTPPPPE